MSTLTHTTPHPQAGETVTVQFAGGRHPQLPPGEYQYRIEDWWDHLTGGSWTRAQGNPAALMYAIRAIVGGLPGDDEVVYGKIGNYGHLVHVSEIQATTEDA